MKELDFIKNERAKLQQEYFKNVKNVWLEFEGEEADTKHKNIYNKYRNKDKFLEVLQSRAESLIEDVEYYKGM